MTQTPTRPVKEASLGDDDAKWAAVAARDAAFDGWFVYSVATTGVYCCPSCPSRLAKRENIRFHATCDDAEAAGFRPCRRCRPNEPAREEDRAAMVARACRLIEEAEEEPRLDDLARACGLSRYHFHRIFKLVAGVTPKAYVIAHRRKCVRERLAISGSVTTAIYDAGFSSSGRFYATSSQLLGMTPGAFRAGGPDAKIKFAVGECSLGSILVAASEIGVCAIQLGDDPDVLARDLQDRFPQAEIIGGDRNFERLVATVVGFVEAPGAAFDLPLDVRGTVFQHRVWAALRDIPPGSTASYTEIARRIGNPKAGRAVAQACAANPVAVAIPCHRVISSDGAISGYRWGVDRKRALLLREAKSIAGYG